jgi:hypothetical protein
MALHFSVKQKKKLDFDIKKLLTEEDFLTERMVYGVCGEGYNIEEGEVGNPTIIFDSEKIGRGIEVDVTEDEILLDIGMPASESDVNLIFELLEKALRVCEQDEFEFDEDVYKKEALEERKEAVKAAQKEALQTFFKMYKEGEHKELAIFGAVHPVSFGQDEFELIGVDSWTKFGEFLHQVQNQDLYYAKPIFLKKDDEVIGLYVLTSSVNSSFPLSPSYLHGNDIEDVRWMVGFYDKENENIIGLVPYEEFLNHTDTTKKLDAARFIVKKDIEEMKSILGKYGENL